jgi:membrane fusion protein, heavy metal efflux system
MLKNIFSTVALGWMLVLAGCGDAPQHAHDGATAEEAHGHPHGEEAGPPSLSYTVYTDQTELFVEFKPLIVGQTSSFAAHLTRLGENFKPLTAGQLTVSLVKGNKGIRTTVDAPRSPGIFGPKLQPNTAGTGYQLIFDVKAKDYTDRLVIDQLTVYPDEKAAMAGQPQETANGNEISYLKEQAWKTDFANQPVKRQPFYNIIKTTGQIMPAQGDEAVLTAPSSGIVSFTGSGLVTGKAVSAGQTLFAIKGGSLTEDNVNVRLGEARGRLQKAKADYDRASELVKDQIIARKEFEAIRLEYNNARREYQALTANFSAGGIQVKTPRRGFIRDIQVTAGAFVGAGQPLATIAQNRNLMLRADVPQQYFGQLKTITSANFRTSADNRVYQLADVNGRLVSYGRNTAAGSYYTPVYFEINNQPQFIPGAFVEVFLKANPTADALLVPTSALLEEQGSYYVYVQTAGETFEKREVKLGGSDAAQVQLLSGVEEGERVVTKGAYQIKLATLSGAMPAHGHEH